MTMNGSRIELSAVAPPESAVNYASNFLQPSSSQATVAGTISTIQSNISNIPVHHTEFLDLKRVTVPSPEIAAYRDYKYLEFNADGSRTHNSINLLKANPVNESAIKVKSQSRRRKSVSIIPSSTDVNSSNASTTKLNRTSYIIPAGVNTISTALKSNTKSGKPPRPSESHTRAVSKVPVAYSNLNKSSLSSKSNESRNISSGILTSRSTSASRQLKVNQQSSTSHKNPKSR